MVRLVKGAYWDTEIKRAQERGLADYPVFTRKAMTDLCYMACARKLLAARPRLYPQFATHNALTVASVIEDAGGVEGYEFQRLHGMGEVLYDAAARRHARGRLPRLRAGRRPRDLLAYLVRRLLENGANSSFVSVAADPSVPIADDPASARRAGSATPGMRAIRSIPLPRDLYRPERRNSAGVEFGDRGEPRRAARRDPQPPRCPTPRRRWSTASRSGGSERPVISPIDGEAIGRVSEGDDAIASAAMAAAQAGFAAWAATPVETRAAALERAGDLLEARRGRLIALLQARRRQDPRRCAGRGARGGRFLPLLRGRGARGAGARSRCRARPARSQRAALSRPRRLRLHQPVEFSAGDLHRPGERRARRRQRGGGEARRADAADRRRGGAAPARGRRAAERAASRAGRRQGRRRAGRRSRASPASPSPARPRSRARSTARSPPRTAPIVPLIAETGGINADDRRRHRAARAGHRRRRHLGLPLGRPALLGAAPAVRAGGRRRPHASR